MTRFEYIAHTLVHPFSASLGSFLQVYSFGSNGAAQFEEAIQQRTSCEIHIFDPTSKPVLGFTTEWNGNNAREHSPLDLMGFVAG